jgi:hypothetical protein
MIKKFVTPLFCCCFRILDPVWVKIRIRIRHTEFFKLNKLIKQNIPAVYAPSSSTNIVRRWTDGRFLSFQGIYSTPKLEV